ncbi:MAG: hypothetical protein EB084_17305 [Proteobacteria bacterium]|nr:hypothetical protein [Pseudomonadota bacterium]
MREIGPSDIRAHQRLRQGGLDEKGTVVTAQPESASPSADVVSLHGTTLAAAPSRPALSAPQKVQGTAVLDALSSDRVACDAIIGRMLIRGGGAARGAQVCAQVREALSTVPLSILRTVEKVGLGITVLRPDEGLEHAGVLRPMREHEFPAAALRRQVDRAVAKADRLYGDHPLFHRAHVNTEVMSVTGGRLRPLAFHNHRKGPIIPITARQIARQHGARLPEEEALLARLFVQVNGRQLEQAQAALGSATGDAPEDRPFRPDAAELFVPDLHFHRWRSDTGEAPVLLDEHDARSARDWALGEVSGQYFPRSPRPTVVLRDDCLGQNEFGSNTPVHEMGHAYEAAVARLDPKTFAGFERVRDRTWQRLLLESENRFPSEYAKVNPQEMVAESFADVYGTQPSRLATLDEQWSHVFHGFLAQADTLGRERPSWLRRWVCASMPQAA